MWTGSMIANETYSVYSSCIDQCDLLSVIYSGSFWARSLLNDCQRLYQGKTKYVPIHDASDPHFLMLPINQHI